jgi:hypothetical protein
MISRVQVRPTGFFKNCLLVYWQFGIPNTQLFLSVFVSCRPIHCTVYNDQLSNKKSAMKCINK